MRCIVAITLLLAVPLLAEDDPYRYDSLWKALEERSESILALASPYREDALRKYHACSDRLSRFCGANDVYASACRDRANGASISQATLKDLSRAATKAWQEYIDALIELEHAISAGAAASRADAVRPGEDEGMVAEPPAEAPAEPPAEVPADPPAEAPAGPTSEPAANAPGDPPASPTASAAPSQTAWAAREKTIVEKLSAAAKAAVRPAFEATLAALEAYAVAQGAANAARERHAASTDAAERQRLLAEIARLREEARLLQTAFDERRAEYQRAKVRASREREPASEGLADARLESFLDGVRRGLASKQGGGAGGGALPPGGTWAAFGALVERAARSGVSNQLAESLRALDRGEAALAGPRGESFGRLLADAAARKEGG